MLSLGRWLANKSESVRRYKRGSFWLASRYQWCPAGVSFEPFIFEMYITDLDCGIVYKISEFSDDTKAGGKVLTTDDCDIT